MSPYRPNEGRFVPEDLDPSLCTYMIYGDAKLIEVEGGWGIGSFEWNDLMDYLDYIIIADIDPDFTMDIDLNGELYTRFHNVTKAHPGLKVSTFYS